MTEGQTHQTRLKRVLEQQERGVSWLARKIGYGYMPTWRVVTGRRPMTQVFRQRAATALGVAEGEIADETEAIAS